MIRRRPIA